MPGAAGQEQVVAVIVPRHGKHPTPEDLGEFVNDLLPGFKRPAIYHLVTGLPRTEVGRLDRAAVQRSYALVTGSPSRLSAVDVATDGDPESDDVAVPDIEPDVAPEVAGDLAELGAKLPGTGRREGRGEQDTDEDLF
jgi:hypothetical protein